MKSNFLARVKKNLKSKFLAGEKEKKNEIRSTTTKQYKNKRKNIIRTTEKLKQQKKFKHKQRNNSNKKM